MRGRAAALCIGLGLVASARTARADDVIAACIAANDEGLALRKVGRLRDSLKRMAACAEPACPGEVRTECNARITELRAVIPTLILVVVDPRGADLAAVVELDGARVSGFVGAATEIDPGSHVFRITAPGRLPAEQTIVVRVGEKDRRETIVLRPPSWWTRQRIAAATAVGLGFAGLVVGGVFTGFAASAKGLQGSACAAFKCSNQPQAVADYNAAVSNATGADVGFIAGGILAAAGVALFVTARTPLSVAPVTGIHVAPLVGRDRQGFTLGGSF